MVIYVQIHREASGLDQYQNSGYVLARSVQQVLLDLRSIDSYRLQLFPKQVHLLLATLVSNQESY